MTTTTTEKSLQRLEEALSAARVLDEQQEHAQAAFILRSAIEACDAWSGKPEDEFEAIADAVVRCGHEADRQERRQALLNSYLYG